MKKVIILFILILTPFMAGAQDSISIKLDKPGKLKKEIKKSEKDLCVLCISGPINNKDIAYIRTLPCLRKLDIRNATIAQGGCSFKVNNPDDYSQKASIGVNTNGDSYIGNHAFSNMNWEIVLLPADLKILEREVFENCKNLKVLQLPDATSIIGKLGGHNNELEHLIFLGESKYFHLPSLAKKITLKNLPIYETLKKSILIILVIIPKKECELFIPWRILIIY